MKDLIHPTAVVSQGAVLGANVRVGPYAVIEGGAHVGENCEIGPHVVITRHVSMGAGNVIHAGAVIGGDPQDTHFDRAIPSRVVLGAENQIREHCTIHRSAARDGITKVGNGCFLMAGSHVAHDCVLGDRVILANSALIGGHCRIGDNVFLGGGAVVHQFVRIGRLSLCKGNSATVQSLPPFVLADGTHGIMGLNTVGLRRAGISPLARASIKAAVALAFRSGLNLSQALEEAEKQTWEPEAAEFFAFLKDPGKRGVSGFLRRSRKSTSDEDA